MSSTVDIIETRTADNKVRFLVGEAHTSGTFGMRSEQPTLIEAWEDARAYADHYKLRIGIVSSLVAAEIVRLGFAESVEEISR